jgi:hypothetical protein
MHIRKVDNIHHFKKEERKFFFSEEKKQKTFVSCAGSQIRDMAGWIRSHSPAKSRIYQWAPGIDGGSGGRVTLPPVFGLPS